MGVLLSGVFFAWKVTRLFSVTSMLSETGRARTYVVHGQVFFASADAFGSAFDVREPLDSVTIDVSHAHFWDISAVAALDRVVLRLRAAGAAVDIVGMNEHSSQIIERLAVHTRSDALDAVPAH